MLKLLHQGGVALRINAPELFGHVQGEEIQNSELRGVALGGGDGDLRSGEGVEREICKLCDRAANHVYNADHLRPARLAFLESGDGVRRLTGLRDHQHQRVLIHHGVGIAQLTGKLHLYRDTAEPFERIAARTARIVG